jgi:hypothetical protein
VLFHFVARSGTRGALIPIAVDAVGCGSNSYPSGDQFRLHSWRPSKAWSFGFLALLNFGLGLRPRFLVDLIEARSSILPIAQRTRVVCRAMGVLWTTGGASTVDFRMATTELAG